MRTCTIAASLLIFFFTACRLSPDNRENGAGGDTAVTTGEELVDPEKKVPGSDDEHGIDGQSGSHAGQHPGSHAAVDRETVLLENSVERQFDGRDGGEVFRIALLGDSVLTGTVAFTISNSSGEIIYTDEFPALMLAATYDESVDTPQEQEELVKERLRQFFSEKSFKTPAIDANMPHDEQFVDKATYDNLRQSEAPGFVYVIGKENGKFIAWSPLEERVVMYFNCC